jgi:hypothetical protein
VPTQAPPAPDCEAILGTSQALERILTSFDRAWGADFLATGNAVVSALSDLAARAPQQNAAQRLQRLIRAYAELYSSILGDAALTTTIDLVTSSKAGSVNKRMFEGVHTLQAICGRSTPPSGCQEIVDILREQPSTHAPWANRDEWRNWIARVRSVTPPADADLRGTLTTIQAALFDLQTGLDATERIAKKNDRLDAERRDLEVELRAACPRSSPPQSPRVAESPVESSTPEDPEELQAAIRLFRGFVEKYPNDERWTRDAARRLLELVAASGDPALLASTIDWLRTKPLIERDKQLGDRMRELAPKPSN